MLAGLLLKSSGAMLGLWIAAFGLAVMLRGAIAWHSVASAGLSRDRIAEFLLLSALAATLMLALISSGLLSATHNLAAGKVEKTGANIYSYRIPGLPPGLALSNDQDRPLIERPTLHDATGPLLSGQNDKRIAEQSPGRFTVWGGVAHFSLRHEGGLEARLNNLIVEGALRPSLRTVILFGVAIALMAGLSRICGFSDGTERRDVSYRGGRRLAFGLMLVAAGLGVFFMLGRGPAASGETLLILTREFRLTQLVSLFCAFLVIAVLPWKAPDFRPGKQAITALLVLAALAAPLLGLFDAWMSGDRSNAITQSGSQMLGAMQANDSFGYLHGGMELLSTGELSDWFSRRPLATAIMALRIMAGAPELTTVMLLGALFVGAGLTLAAREMVLAAGASAAFAFVLACAAFASEWTPTAMSEVPGFALGLFAFAALLAGWRRHSLMIFAAGAMLMAVALTARAGPLLALPCIIIAGTLDQRRRSIKAMAKWAIVSLIATVIGIAHSPYLIHTLNGKADAQQGNFSYTLYSLAVGGKGWTQIFEDHPEFFTTPGRPEDKVYALAFEKIRNDPRTLIRTLASETVKVPGLFLGFFDVTILNVWLVTGVLAALFGWRHRLNLLAVLAMAGIFASAPILIADGNVRVFAAAVPFLALVIALGFAASRQMIEQIAGGGKLALCRRPNGRAQSTSPAVIEPSFLATAGLLVAIAATPFIIAADRRKPASLARHDLACAAGEMAIIVLPEARLTLFKVKANSASRQTLIPDISQNNIIRHADGFDPGMAKALSAMQAPYQLMTMPIIRKSEQPIDVFPTLIAWPDALPIIAGRAPLAMCAVRLGATSPDVVGPMDIWRVEKAKPLGG